MIIRFIRFKLFGKDILKDLSGRVSLIYKNRKLAYKCYQKRKHNGAIVDAKLLNQKIGEFIKNPVWANYKISLLPLTTTVAIPAIAPTG